MLKKIFGNSGKRTNTTVDNTSPVPDTPNIKPPSPKKADAETTENQTTNNETSNENSGFWSKASNILGTAAAAAPVAAYAPDILNSVQGFFKGKQPQPLSQNQTNQLQQPLQNQQIPSGQVTQHLENGNINNSQSFLNQPNQFAHSQNGQMNLMPIQGFASTPSNQAPMADSFGLSFNNPLGNLPSGSIQHNMGSLPNADFGQNLSNTNLGIMSSPLIGVGSMGMAGMPSIGVGIGSSPLMGTMPLF